MYNYKTKKIESKHYLFFTSNMIRTDNMDGGLNFYDHYEPLRAIYKSAQPFDERNPAFEFVHYANTDNAIDRPENYYRQFSNGEVLITVYDDNNDDLEILITYYDKLDRQNVTESFDELAQDSKILGLLNDKQIRLVRKKLTDFYNAYMDTPERDRKYDLKRLQEIYLTYNY